jgi:hypothetical protein
VQKIDCEPAALPFFRNSLVSEMTLSLLIFGIAGLVRCG